MRFVKPLDEELLHSVCKRFNKIVTLEESSIIGGFGSAVSDFMSENNYKSDILKIALPDAFVEHGTQAELHAILEMDPEGITKRVTDFLK